MRDLYTQVENAVFQALAHPLRRTILKIVSSTNGITYSELITELQIPTCKQNYNRALFIANRHRFLLHHCCHLGVHCLCSLERRSTSNRVRFAASAHGNGD